MRAWLLPKPDGIDSLELVERPRPQPGRRQILVRVLACSLNFRDLSITLGRYRMASKPDLVPLSDGAGEVVEIGEDVQRFKAGDRVAGCFFQRWVGGPADPFFAMSALGGAIDGMAAEYVVLEEDGAVHIPAHLSFEEAATLPCAAVTAWNALVEHGRMTIGQTVLVQGTGGVSIFALQLARAAGLAVVATSSSDEKIERLKTMGAAITINYKSTPDWDRAATDSTGGGVDQVVEVGGPGTFAKSVGAIRMGGKVSMIGVLSQGAEINPMILMGKRADVRGIFVGSTRMFEALNSALTVNKIKPVIDRTFAFDQAKDAFRHMQSGAHFGKIVLKL